MRGMKPIATNIAGFDSSTRQFVEGKAEKVQ